MKILVFSDSHGNPAFMQRVLKLYDVQTVIHLGDGAKDLLKLQSEYPAINMVAVAGNCDYYSDAPGEQVITVGQGVTRRILLLHGHNHSVKMGLNRLMYYAQEKEVDACLFGHTHIPLVDRHGAVFFMNPGSIAKPVPPKPPSYGILTISDDGGIAGEVLTL